MSDQKSAYHEALNELTFQFGRDVQMSIGTARDGRPSVRVVDGYYKEGAFYVMSDLRSNKMREIAVNPNVGLCFQLFNARGTGENLGSPLKRENAALREELREAFRLFYRRRVDEDSPDTCILKIKLRDAVIFTDDAKYTIDFENGTAEKIAFSQLFLVK